MNQSNITLSFKILPHVPEDKLYFFVDKVIRHIQASGIPHLVGPSETTLEGPWHRLMKLVEECQDLCIALGAPRVSTVIMSDYRPETGVTIDEKASPYR